MKNASVLDADTNYSRLDVLVENEKIVEVGSDLPIGDAEILDLTGKTLLPGFIDSHVHVVDRNRPREEMLRAFAQNGVAAIRDLGILGTMEVESYLAWLGERKGSEYTQVVTAGRYIDIRGGYGMGPDPSMMWGIEIHSPEEAARMVAYEVECGVDGIKIGLQDGALGPVGSKMPPAFISAITAEAKKLGVWSTAHIGKVEDLETVVDCGIGSAAHTPKDVVMSERIIDRMVAQDIPMTTTVGDPFSHVASMPMVPPAFRNRDDFLQHCLADRDIVRENLRRFYQAGGTILVATDLIRLEDAAEQAVIPVVELRCLRDIGMSTQEVIAAATINNAKACQIDDLGLIRPGMRASVLAVDGDLDNEFNKLIHPAFVMNRGIILRNVR